MIEVTAVPDNFSFDPQRTALVVIDMQRDFIEPGGFGAALGNDVTPLAAIIPAVQQLLALGRKAGLLVIHTRESHLPDLSDCPPAKRAGGPPGRDGGQVHFDAGRADATCCRQGAAKAVHGHWRRHI